MGSYKEEYVVVRRGLKLQDPSEITINCPDKMGLGFDLAQIVLEFGLYVTKGDISTDGRWCFVVLMVTPFNDACPSTVRWTLLKQRLEDICPSALAPCWLPPVAPPVPESERILLLQVCSPDRTGLLHGVVQKMWKMELTIHKVKVSTSPNGKAIGLFFVTDNRTKLPWSQKRAEELETKLEKYLGCAYSVCEIIPAGPEYGGLACLPLPASVTTEIFCDDPATFEPNATINRKAVENPANRVVVTVENNTSPVHTLLFVSCRSRNGLLYDCLRTVKDLNLKVAHARIPNVVQGLQKGNLELCLFVVDAHGRKITDVQEQKVLVQCLEEAVGNPLRIKVGTTGVDTELLVATPIEKGGRDRPRVLYNITHALNILHISVFKADVGRHEYNDEHWVIYRFLLVEKESEPPLTSSRMRNRIVNRVRQALSG